VSTADQKPLTGKALAEHLETNVPPEAHTAEAIDAVIQENRDSWGA
jgi:hypothetical protein